MKVKQPRRWKKDTVQEQGEISNRFSGRILWAMLLLGGIGTLIALGSHSAVSMGEVKVSGRTVTRLIPALVGMRLLPLRSTNPAATIFAFGIAI